MFEQNNFQKVDFSEKADIYVINTCSVTDNADKKCKKVVKEALKHSPDAFIAIVGCYAQLKPTEIAEIPGVDAVLGAAEKFNLVNVLKDFEKKPKAQIFNSDIKEVRAFNDAYSYGDRTRTFLKVQDGCNYNCSFCTIPLARGRSRSNSIANIVESARQIAQTDVKEVVITGVNIGDFGIDPETNKRTENFFDLVKQLDEVEGINRIRISSIEPNLLSNDIISFVADSKRFVPHFHIPLQSGNNRILKEMRRRYQRELYADRVNHIKTVMPHCCIGVDVIVGFPGETEEDFLDTYKFLNELDISYLHVFPYSERANTHAAEMEAQISQKEKNKRVEMLRILSEKKKRHFYEQHLGKTYTVLFEEDVENGIMQGFTENYIRVSAKYDPLLVNELKRVTLTQIDANGYMEAQDADIEVLAH